MANDQTNVNHQLIPIQGSQNIFGSTQPILPGCKILLFI
jgi:hypothetical protein